MIASVTIAESIAAFGGKKGGTSTKQVGEALQKLGRPAELRLRNFTDPTELPATCILKVRFAKNQNWHWVVFHLGTVYCPDQGCYPFADIAKREENALCTSYLVVN
jgi:hypothetical protein